MNTKGDLTGLLFLIVSISAFAIFLLIVGYVAPQISEGIKDNIGISAEINNSLNTTTNIARNTFPVIWMILFVGLLLGLFATSYLIETHPIFIPIFVLLLIIAIVVSVPLSNAYIALSEDTLLTGTSIQQSLIVFIMQYLPFITFVIGLLSLVITFAKPGSGGGNIAYA